MPRKSFYSASKDFGDRVTELYDSVWPCAAAMWNLRWQVCGFVAEHPGVKESTLQARFTEGSGIRGANLTFTCTKRTWESQQDFFARVVLVNLFAHYESWSKSIFDKFSIKDLDSDAMLFWDRGGNRKKKGNIEGAIDILAKNKSDMFLRTFGSVYMNSKRYHRSELESLVRCARYFKEIRNSLAHSGMLTTNTLVRAYEEWKPFATASRMRLKEVPEHEPPVLGKPCVLRLRGVVGLGKVMNNIVTTVDAELSQTTQAQVEFESRWNSEGTRLCVKRDGSDIERKVRGKIERMGLIVPNLDNEFLDYLKRTSLVVTQ